jgi:hypothetical protein
MSHQFVGVIRVDEQQFLVIIEVPEGVLQHTFGTNWILRISMLPGERVHVGFVD